MIRSLFILDLLLLGVVGVSLFLVNTYLSLAFIAMMGHTAVFNTLTHLIQQKEKKNANSPC